ncbi:MAG TPA: NAD(P)-dependent oxidoreductase [Geminicoccaceae bacterium]|nr:NAD(P)-dependent oxidoreductase [Geminicoccaceae bacterium]
MAAAEIVISEFMDPGAVEGLAGEFAVAYDPGLVDRPDELRAALGAARALIVRNRTRVRGALLEAAPRLAVVGRLGVGLDNIDVEACRARGIEVIPATGANDDAVAEYVVAAVLLLMRGAFMASGEVATGRWPRERLIGREVMGRTLGLLGFGGTARAVARRAVPLGMAVVAHDPQIEADSPVWSAHGVAPVGFEALLHGSDALSLHVPLTPATRGLIDARALGAMRRGAVLVNAARGGVVDAAALVEALKDGHLGGAALDVFETEPLPADNPFAAGDVPNLILTPHVAGVTAESNVRVSRLIADAVRAHLLRGDRPA